MKLHLGVVDLPHPVSRGKSTGDIAELLESKYAIMATFFEMHAAEITGLLEGAMQDAMEDALSGGAGDVSMLGAETGIELLFRTFIASRGMDGAPGVPTRAALKGVSHRFAHPYRKGNPQRPSFVDTGTYTAAFKAWTEGALGGSGGGGLGAYAATAAADVEEAV